MACGEYNSRNSGYDLFAVGYFWGASDFYPAPSIFEIIMHIIMVLNGMGGKSCFAALTE